MSVAIFALGALMFAATLFTALFRRTQIPDVLLLIILGILIGPVFHFVSIDDFGKVGRVMSSVALVVILFQSGLSLDLTILKRSIAPTSVITLLSFAATMIVVALAGWMALGLPVMLALSLGAIVGGTSSAVVIPIVQQLSMDVVPATTLILESALTDVLCIILAIALLDAAALGSPNPLSILWAIVVSLSLAVITGLLAGMVLLLFANLLRSQPNAVLTLLAYVFLTYGLAEMLGFSGAIAALALGFTLTNRVGLGITRLRWYSHLAEAQTPRYLGQFLDDVVFLLKTFFFVFLGISIRFAATRVVLWAVGTVVVVYLARAVIVRYTAPRGTSTGDASLMAVMVPKGLAAAVLAGIPAQRGLPEGEIMQQFTYMIVLVSIVVTSLCVPLVQRPPFKR